jgi:hypothetical protein
VLVPPVPLAGGVAGAGLPADGAAGVAGAVDELSIVEELVDDVVCGSVEEPPICDQTNAPTNRTAITATHGTHDELPVRTCVAL